MTQNKRVLITGAAARIGKNIATKLAENGWDIAIHYNSSAAPAEALAKTLRATTGTAPQVFQANLSNEAETQSLIPQVTAAMGPLAALINNASVFNDDTIETMTRASWDLHIETNLRAPLVLAQSFAAQHKTAPDAPEGNIINLLDQRVLKLTPQFLTYTLSKSALWTLTRTLAQALGPQNIRVNGIGPGPTIQNARQSAADFTRQTSATVLGHGSQPEDIAAGVLYILNAPALTGQMLALDGGQHLIWQTPDVTNVVE